MIENYRNLKIGMQAGWKLQHQPVEFKSEYKQHLNRNEAVILQYKTAVSKFSLCYRVYTNRGKAPGKCLIIYKCHMNSWGRPGLCLPGFPTHLQAMKAERASKGIFQQPITRAINDMVGGREGFEWKRQANDRKVSAHINEGHITKTWSCFTQTF